MLDKNFKCMIESIRNSTVLKRDQMTFERRKKIENDSRIKNQRENQNMEFNVVFLLFWSVTMDFYCGWDHVRAEKPPD